MNREGISFAIFLITWTLGLALLFKINPSGSLFGLYWLLCATISFLYWFALGRKDE